MRDAAILLIAVLLLFFLVIGIPVLSGQTFGQRCAKAYPDDPAQQEWCVERVRKGGLVYPKSTNEEQPQ